MKLSRITIKNFRRIDFVDIRFSSSSFLIGPNNVGKTSIIKAIDALLSLSNKISYEDFRIISDEKRAKTIEICGYFTGLDKEIANSKGFKGRVVDGQFIYKKVYNINSPNKPRIYTVQYDYNLVDDFKDCDKWQDLIDRGYSEEELAYFFGKTRPQNDKLPKGWEFCIEGAIEWDLKSEPKDYENPGGIPSIVLSKLPRLVHIPSYANIDDIGKADSNRTLLGECLGILFEDLLAQSEIATKIQDNLTQLQKEMSPSNENSIIYNLCKEVNNIIEDVFPGCGIHIDPSLKDLQSVLRPQYTVEMFSNVNTDAERQGTGLVRTGIFSMLRYHSKIKSKSDSHIRPLLVAFEEPEIYLHPSAANLLRDTIYSLGETDQIICTTHSPWMIDLTKDWISLTKLYLDSSGFTKAINYGISEAMKKLSDDEKEKIKMVKFFDDELSRVFFSEKCVIVEGDSELIAIKNTIKHLSEETRKEVLAKIQIVKARGKAIIIPLVKYLKALNIPFYVIHDRDKGKAGAEKFNSIIAKEVGDPSKISVLEECLEDVLGYEVPSSDKPYMTFKETSKWRNWDEISDAWKEVFCKAFLG